MAIYLNNTTKFDILPLDESAHATIYPNSATGFELPPYWRDVPQRVPSPAKAAEGENYPSEPSSRTAESRPSEAFRSVRTGMETPYLGRFFRDRISIKHEEERDWWSPSIDPTVSVVGKNIIVRRNVAKAEAKAGERRGSIKERWSTDDYEVTIAGWLINTLTDDLPETELEKLRRYCEAKKTVEIRGRLLDVFGIRYLSIEDFSLPFTKGLRNQTYTIKGYSDDVFDLLIKD